MLNRVARLEDLGGDRGLPERERDGGPDVDVAAREERGALERRVTELERRESPEAGDKAGALFQRFLDEAGDNRELLVSLIERVELTEQRELIIHFRFCPPEALF